MSIIGLAHNYITQPDISTSFQIRDAASDSYKDGLTLLLWATVYGDEAMVKLLVGKAADVDSKDKGGQTP
jgi:ankyrin repeat protein